MRVVVGGNLGGKLLGTSGEFLLVTLPLLLVQGWMRVSIEIVYFRLDMDRKRMNVLLGSTPPLVAFASLLASPNKSQSQSGYSWSSLASTSGLFLK